VWLVVLLQNAPMWAAKASTLMLSFADWTRWARHVALQSDSLAAMKEASYGAIKLIGVALFPPPMRAYVRGTSEAAMAGRNLMYKWSMLRNACSSLTKVGGYIWDTLLRPQWSIAALHGCPPCVPWNSILAASDYTFVVENQPMLLPPTQEGP
jgi:hypothetical protein